ncbi:simple sugar transport system permease protein [Ensifer sp. YR511]|nr:ABC transporter permease [Ensifer sp. YR511]SDN52108.1 simple sugar transport system permease protein [Ensifer sp. YR511]
MNSKTASQSLAMGQTSTPSNVSGFSVGGLFRRPEAGAFLGLFGVFVFFLVFGSIDFLKPSGAASWLNVAANLGIVAFPIGLLMIAGELDISIGSMIPAGSMTVAIISGYYGLPIWIGIAASLALGVFVGLVNGILVVRTNVPSLIVTLGTLFAVAGLVLGLSVLLTGTTSVALKAPGIAKFLFGQFVANTFQVIIFWWLALTALYVYVVHYSPWGNWIFAMGGDKISARNAGIPTARLTIALFVLSSTSAAFVGMCQAILFNSAQVSAGMSFIFNSIISVVVGGVLLTGGFGSIIGIFFGTITFAVVNQGIYFTSFDRNWSSLIIGVMLLLAVLMNNTFRSMALSYSPKKK